ncbi:MAG: hypothetical protein Q9182_007333 [Xanthomendoza sp. 2 TL-2023]
MAIRSAWWMREAISPALLPGGNNHTNHPPVVSREPHQQWPHQSPDGLAFKELERQLRENPGTHCSLEKLYYAGDPVRKGANFGPARKVESSAELKRVLLDPNQKCVEEDLSSEDQLTYTRELHRLVPLFGESRRRISGAKDAIQQMQDHPFFTTVRAHKSMAAYLQKTTAALDDYNTRSLELSEQTNNLISLIFNIATLQDTRVAVEESRAANVLAASIRRVTIEPRLNASALSQRVTQKALDISSPHCILADDLKDLKLGHCKERIRLSLCMFTTAVSMDAIVLPMSPRNHLKRTYNDAGLDNSLSDSLEPSAAEGLQEVTTSDPYMPMPQPVTLSQTTSPAILSNPAETLVHSSHAHTTDTPVIPSTSLNPAKKRTKLSEAEKQAKRLEKEAKEEDKARQKAKKEEDRIRKEEERAKKDEERRAKDAEKERKRQEKEEQVKLKEDERRKKDEEREKKAKMRLNSFFVTPALSNDGPSTSMPQGSPSPANSRRSSIVSLHDTETPTRERSASVTPSKSKLSSYAQLFPPFFLLSHTTLASPSQFKRDEEGLQYTQKTIDESLSSPADADAFTTFDPYKLLHLAPYKRRKLNAPRPSVKQIVERLHGTSQNPIDLTDSQKSRVSQEPLNVLKTISTRFLKFVEDVRPPYIGTFTRVQDPTTALRICRNPFARALPDADYDYDSEAEWEEPGEGEDLDSEGEEENESEDGDDLEGFLDDEGATDAAKALQKRRIVTGNLEPISTGLCWEDEHENHTLADLTQYRLEIMLGKFCKEETRNAAEAAAENPQAPIDPYSTTYWPSAPSNTASTSSIRTSQSIMDPPRIPLTAINRTNLLMPNPATALDSPKSPANSQAMPPPRVAKAAKRMVAPEVLEDFKRAVNGSDLTKAGLIEILKKQFPKQSKDAIKDTLSMIAERVGPREKDKKWVVR